MGDIFCVQCGRYHQSLSFCPNEQPEPIVIGRADFGQSEQVAALERELAEVKKEWNEWAQANAKWIMERAHLLARVAEAERELAAKDARIGELAAALRGRGAFSRGT